MLQDLKNQSNENKVKELMALNKVNQEFIDELKDKLKKA